MTALQTADNWFVLNQDPSDTEIAVSAADVPTDDPPPVSESVAPAAGDASPEGVESAADSPAASGPLEDLEDDDDEEDDDPEMQSDPEPELSLWERIVELNSEIVRLSMREAELKEQAKAVAKQLDGVVEERRELERAVQAELDDKARGQGRLFSHVKPATVPKAETAESPPVPSSPSDDKAKLTALESLGLTDSQVDKLAAAEIETVAQLEASIRDGKLQFVKGVGPKAIDSITDKLLEWRKSNPVPLPA